MKGFDYPIVNLDFLNKRPLSASSLKAFKKSPKHYLHYLVAQRVPPTAAQVLGSIVDCLLLTDGELNNKFIVEPDINCRTSQGKKDWAEFEKLAAGKLIVDQKTWDKAHFMRDSVLNNNHCMDVLNRVTQTQSTNKWLDEITQLPCLGILDGEGDDLILELKTSYSAHEEDFVKNAFNLHYPLQVGMYYESLLAKGKRNIQVKYIVVESIEPFEACVYTATKEFINYGREELGNLLNDFKVCINNNDFSYGYKNTSLDLPNWARFKRK